MHLAIIPQLIGPLQALWAAVAQLVPYIAGLVAGALGLGVWRHRIKGLGLARGRRRFAVLAALCIAAGAVAMIVVSRRRAGPGRATTAAPAAAQRTVTPQCGVWDVFRGNSGRTGNADGLRGPRRARILWSYTDEDNALTDFSSSPAVSGGRLFVGSASANVFRRDGAVRCLDITTGARLWHVPTEQQVFSSPCVAAGRVYVGEGLHQDAGSALRCLDARTGAVLWVFPTASHVESSPAVRDGRVYFGAGDDGLYCADAKTGEKVWNVDGYHVDAGPVVARGLVFVGSGYGTKSFLAVDARDGRIAWKRTIPASAWGHPAVHSNAVYFAVSNVSLNQRNATPSGVVFRVDADSGQERWRVSLPDGISAAIAVDSGQVFVACWDRHLYCLAETDGELLWKTGLDAKLYGAPALDDECVFQVTMAGRIVCLDRASGKTVWALDVDESGDTRILASPALAGGRLYVGTSRNQVLCIGEGRATATSQ